MKHIQRNTEHIFTHNFDATQRREEDYSMQTSSIIRSQKEYIELLNRQINTLEPKARAYDIFLKTDGLTSMEVAAKSLGLGHYTLLRYLREQRILTQKGAPYERYMKRGYFQVRYKTVWTPNKGKHKVHVVLLTSRGMDFVFRTVYRNGPTVHTRYTDSTFEWYLRSLDEADSLEYDLMEVVEHE